MSILYHDPDEDRSGRADLRHFILIEDEPVNIFSIEEEGSAFMRAVSRLTRRWRKRGQGSSSSSSTPQPGEHA